MLYNTTYLDEFIFVFVFVILPLMFVLFDNYRSKSTPISEKTKTQKSRIDYK